MGIDSKREKKYYLHCVYTHPKKHSVVYSAKTFNGIVFRLRIKPKKRCYSQKHYLMCYKISCQGINATRVPSVKFEVYWIALCIYFYKKNGNNNFINFHSMDWWMSNSLRFVPITTWNTINIYIIISIFLLYRYFWCNLNRFFILFLKPNLFDVEAK